MDVCSPVGRTTRPHASDKLQLAILEYGIQKLVIEDPSSPHHLFFKFFSVTEDQIRDILSLSDIPSPFVGFYFETSFCQIAQVRAGEVAQWCSI